MKLNYSLPLELVRFLDSHSSRTLTSMESYLSSEDFHNLFYQGDDHLSLYKSVGSIPDISDKCLVSYSGIVDNIINPLSLSNNDPDLDIVRSTLRSHFYKLGSINPSGGLASSLTIALGRCILPFMLEQKCTAPKKELYSLSRGKVKHFLHLPKRPIYSMLHDS